MENKIREGEIEEDISTIWQECKNKLQLHNYPHVEDCDDGSHVFHFLCEKLTNLRKNCLLYGALFPQDERIYADFLIECWGVERFITQDEGTSAPIFKRTRVAGYNELQCLENAGLLTSAELKHVTMPPLFRRWALRMDYGLQMLVRCTEADEAGYPEPENRRSKARISLRCNKDLKALLQGVRRKGILALFLHRNPNVIERILSSIFVKGSRLQILDLGHTEIELLPESISNLRALKALYLNDCVNLRKLPSKITKLKETLEILDVSRTGIPYLPAKIGDLSGLRCLRVSFNAPRPTNAISSGPLSCWKNQSRVPIRNVISRLPLLEELAISVAKESQALWVDVIGDVIQDMANLEVLTTLHLHFPSVHHLADFIAQNMSWRRMGSSSGENAFRAFKFIVGSFEGDHDTKKNKDMDMAEHKAERHFQVFASERSPSELATHSSSAIQDVLKQSTTFELIGDQMIDHFSSFGIDRIANLKACAIRSCSKMRSIISNGHSTADAALPRLEVLELFKLCSLESIYGAGLLGDSSFANLTTLIVVSCDALRVILPFELAHNVTNLKHLTVKDCLSVAAIIALDEAVSNTASSQVLVATDAADENPTSTLEADETPTNFLPNGERLHNGAGGQVAHHAADQNRSILLGKLETLILDDLANLQTISHDVSLRWPSLQKLTIVQCDRLKNLPLSVENVGKLKPITCHEHWWRDVPLIAAGVSEAEVIKAQFSCDFVERHVELLL